MDYDIYCPYNLYYYTNKPVIIRTIDNTSDEYIWGYSYPENRHILLVPPNTKRNYIFLNSIKKIILKYKKISYIVNLSYNNILTVP